MHGQGLRAVVLVSTMVSVCGASAALAETLAEALVKAYEGSPLLDAHEAALESLDECAAQTRTERRPKLDLSGGLPIDGHRALRGD